MIKKKLDDMTPEEEKEFQDEIVETFAYFLEAIPSVELGDTIYGHMVKLRATFIDDTHCPYSDIIFELQWRLYIQKKKNPKVTKLIVSGLQISPDLRDKYFCPQRGLMIWMKFVETETEVLPRDTKAAEDLFPPRPLEEMETMEELEKFSEQVGYKKPMAYCDFHQPSEKVMMKYLKHIDPSFSEKCELLKINRLDLKTCQCVLQVDKKGTKGNFGIRYDDLNKFLKIDHNSEKELKDE